MKSSLNNEILLKSYIKLLDRYLLSCATIAQIKTLCKEDYILFGDKELRYDTLEDILNLIERVERNEKVSNTYSL